jgi:hypothetical protein
MKSVYITKMYHYIGKHVSRILTQLAHDRAQRPAERSYTLFDCGLIPYNLADAY